MSTKPVYHFLYDDGEYLLVDPASSINQAHLEKLAWAYFPPTDEWVRVTLEAKVRTYKKDKHHEVPSEVRAKLLLLL